eukprot:12618073-Alexandrium_andersonii.AAC.1
MAVRSRRRAGVFVATLPPRIGLAVSHRGSPLWHAEPFSLAVGEHSVRGWRYLLEAHCRQFAAALPSTR